MITAGKAGFESQETLSKAGGPRHVLLAASAHQQLRSFAVNDQIRPCATP